ncbi:MAG: hypothetical protein Q4P15_11430 [Propionibacteriaceae bacterium]|nr:hypothetical protein [Propionibacteriaceae bacterium]
MAGCLAAVAFGVIAITAVIIFGAVALVAGSGLDPTTPTSGYTPAPPITPNPEPPPPPTPEPDPEPEPEPAAIPDRNFPPLAPPNSEDPAWVSVQQAAMYAVEFPDITGCPEPALLETLAELEPWASAEIRCLQDAWKPVLASLGLNSADVPHFFFEGSSSSSPCGSFTAPAYYCSADGGSIHFGEDLLLGTSHDPIWGKDLVAHEYGHHLQGASGFFNAIYELPPGNETVRRNEIQATCLGFGMLRRDDSIVLEREFYDSLEPHLRSFLDDDIHGSPDSLANWGMRGFHADLLAQCNTWVASSAEVQ